MREADTPVNATLSTGAMLWLGVATRIFIDTSNQIFNPFLTVFAAGLGTSVIVLGALVSLRSVAGFTGPLLGAMADRIGYLVMMRFGLLATAAGLFLFGLSTNLWLAGVSVVPMGIGLAIFAPALQAYLSERLAYSKRARGLGIVEYSFALAGILGLPLAGQLIRLIGWRAPFFALAGLLLLAWALSFLLPPLHQMHTATVGDFQSWRGRLASFFNLGSAGRSAWGSVLLVGLTFFAIMNVIIIHSAWLSEAYGLNAVELGGVALLLGLADLSGVVLVSLVVDSFGKRRSVLVGLMLSLAGYLVLPLLTATTIRAIIGLAIVRFLMQVAYVSNIPLLSEQVPRQRGKVMALGFAFGQLGLALAGLTGPWLYLTYGVWGLGLASALAMVIGLAVTAAWVREAPLSHSP